MKKPFSDVEKKYKTLEGTIKAIFRKIDSNPNQRDYLHYLGQLSRCIEATLDLVLATLQENHQHQCYHIKDISLLVLNLGLIFEQYLNSCKSHFTSENLQKNNSYSSYKEFLENHTLKLKKIGGLLRKNKESEKLINHIALYLSSALSDLGIVYNGLKELELSLHAHTAADDWIGYINSSITGEIHLPRYKMPLTPDLHTLKRFLIVNKYIILHQLFKEQNYLSEAQHYLELAAKNSDRFFFPPVLDSLYSLASIFFKQKKFPQSFKLFDLYYEYWQKANHHLLTPTAAATYKNFAELLKRELSLLKEDAFQENMLPLNDLNLKNTSVKFYLPNYFCLITLEGTPNLKDPGLKTILSHFKYDIQNANSLIIHDCYQYKTHQFKNLLITLENLTQAKPAISELDENMSKMAIQPVTQVTPPTTAEATEKVQDLPPSAPKLPKRKKGKERLVVKEEEKDIQLKEKTASPSTTHTLGFHTQEDEKLYALGGNTIPQGIFYAYGIKLSNGTDKVTSQDLKHYQTILENGKIVPKGRQGLRVVRAKESGLGNITFKITDPAKDLRIMLELEEVIEDEKHRKKYLYRAGKAVFHRK